MDIGNISDREFQIELLRSVLKLPEDLITKIVSLAYDEALELFYKAVIEKHPELSK